MSKIVPIQAPTERTIITTYYVNSRRLESMRVTRSKYPRSAMMRALDAMSMDKYPGATVAVIYDEEYGQDHGIITRHKNGQITVDFERDQTLPQHSLYYSNSKFENFKIKAARPKNKNVTNAKFKEVSNKTRGGK